MLPRIRFRIPTSFSEKHPNTYIPMTNNLPSANWTISLILKPSNLMARKLPKTLKHGLVTKNQLCPFILVEKFILPSCNFVKS